MPFRPIKRRAFPEVVPVDNLNFDVYGASVRKFRRSVEDRKFYFRAFPMNIAWDEFQIDYPIIAFKEKSRVDKRYQE